MKFFSRKVVKVAAMALLSTALLTGCGDDKQKEVGQSGSYKVGVVQLVEHAALDAANKGFVDGLAEAGIKDNVVFDQQNAQADQSNLNTIARRFVSDKVDLIAAIATPAAQAVANTTKDIPIVATAVTDYEQAKLVKTHEHPGTNVTGTSDMNPVEKQVDLIIKLLPQAKTVGIIYSSSEVNSQIQAERMKAYATSRGLQVEEVTVSSVNDVQQAVQNLVNKKVDALYLPTDNVVASSVASITKISNEARIPAFPGEGNLIKDGCLATYSVNYYRLGLQAGKMAAAILRGEKKPAEMPVEAQTDLELVVNKDVAAQLGIVIPTDLAL